MQQQRTLYEFDRKVWGICPCGGYGYDYPANQALIPSFLQRHPDVVSAAVSLFPREGPPAPQGSFSKGCGGIVPLVVEDFGDGRSSCELTIDGRNYYLQEGEGFLWDDTFMHSAINRSSRPRVVLLFDVFRRDQPFWLIGMSWIFLWVAQIWQHVQNMRGRAGLR